MWRRINQHLGGKTKKKHKNLVPFWSAALEWILTLTHAEFPLQTTAESKRKKLQTPLCTLVSHFEREKKKKCVVNLMRKFQDMSYDCSYLSPRRHRWFISATKLLLTPRNADEKNKFISGLHSESLTLVMRKPSYRPPCRAGVRWATCLCADWSLCCSINNLRLNKAPAALQRG